MGSRTRALVLLATTAATLLTAPVTAQADHRHGGPSARQVAAGKAAVARREHQVRAAAAGVEAARRQAHAFAASAEVAVEAFNASRLRERTARREVRTAELVVAAAGAQVAAARERVDRFAAAAYMSGGMSAMQAMLGADGPESLVYRVSTLQAVASSQRDATQALDAARVYQRAVADHARIVLARARALTAAADRARAAAEAAVQRQTVVLDSLRHRQHRLASLLRRARQHASALERARLAAIARARARAAARAAAAAAAAARRAATAGATGDVAGTASAATQRAAVRYAESQLGKPYQWGAAGPDSYDCSGLVMWAYARAGVTLDHWTGYQWQEGVRISPAAARPGDLFFFATDTSNSATIHHVGIYIGGGQMVEAPYTGANVRISSAWRSDLIGAVRPWDR